MEYSSIGQLPLDQIYTRLGSAQEGLSNEEAEKRLSQYGPNTLKSPKRWKGLILFVSQFKSPLILLLIGAAILSFFLRDKADSIIIFAIVILSGLLGFFQERGAINSLAKLMQIVESRTSVLRNGKEIDIPHEQIVPGDVLILRAGDLVPADCILIETNYFFVDEATLTGESAPVEKKPGDASSAASFMKQNNAIFLGTMVSSGMAKAIVIATGCNTQYSSISDRTRFTPPETAFELGVRKFGYFLLEVTSILVIIIFAFNIYFKKPVIESFLFSLALAVGLTPQLLPAIISVNLSHGARRMAKKRVVVKRLASIENFGQMNILCTDKTGTITIGKIQLAKTSNILGEDSSKAAEYGFLNSHFQSGYVNPLDQAILQGIQLDVSTWSKTQEIPYDFVRKRISILLKHEGKQLLISKGAVPEILSICDRIELPDGKIQPLNNFKDKIKNYFEEQSKQGFRTLAVAYGETDKETNLIFLGFLHFFDPIKSDIVQTIGDLKTKGVDVKIITGDHRFVAAHVSEFLGMANTSLVTGEELHKIDDHALLKIAHQKNVFAEIEPNQKERIILALRKSGHVVGFLGDGVNDVSALHSADVGIAVDSGADAAKEIADIVLLEKDLSVLRDGIEEGRRTFANTLKYVYMATSANFGNMFSMAGASLFLNFLPLLPKQVLLTNFLSDFPEMALATDRVDYDTVKRPVKWNLPFIRKFMLVFGLISSVADYLTFGVLLLWLRTDETLFRTGWFVESVVSAALIVLAIRTKKSLLTSKPGKLLLVAVLAIAILTCVLPYTPLAHLFGLAPLPPVYYLILSGIVAFYIISVEVAKRFFFHNHNHKHKKIT
ncbi:MAG TPA: magnesium-translocating P-type ATPase [Rhabdochlamydiaceae bacterium]|nr:magnesium-translocating P-type ATPase [Rhabdochlamydiaceae bacterium]